MNTEERILTNSEIDEIQTDRGIDDWITAMLRRQDTRSFAVGKAEGRHQTIAEILEYLDKVDLREPYWTTRKALMAKYGLEPEASQEGK